MGGAKTALTDAGAFFAALRRGVLGPTLSDNEVIGCNVILEACGADSWPIADTAYALATAYHETAGTMLPIREYGGHKYLFNMYDPGGSRPGKARELGNVHSGDGVLFAGRGYVQLTGRANYVRASGIVGQDLVSNPDLAMRPAIAAKILVSGMRRGWFTGRDLDDDLPREGPASLEQFVKSRDIINGKDKAAKIAAEAVYFQNALLAGKWS